MKNSGGWNNRNHRAFLGSAHNIFFYLFTQSLEPGLTH